MGTFAQRLPLALRDEIGKLARPGPGSLLSRTPTVFIYASSAMYEYYLGEDGAAYERDMDKFDNTRVLTYESSLREVYREAIARYPQLAALADIQIVERDDPDTALLGAFHRGVETWSPERTGESREAAIARWTAYFATRMEEPGPAFVYLPIPDPSDRYTTLHLHGDEPELELELQVVKDTERSAEIAHRGHRASVIAFLRSPQIGETLIGVEELALSRAR